MTIVPNHADVSVVKFFHETDESGTRKVGMETHPVVAWHVQTDGEGVQEICRPIIPDEFGDVWCLRYRGVYSLWVFPYVASFDREVDALSYAIERLDRR